MTQEKQRAPQAARQVEDLPVRAERDAERAKAQVEDTRGVGLDETQKA